MIYGNRTSGGEHGTVYTNEEVVNFILSLTGLNTLSDFLGKRILDPSVGEGAFVIPLIRRILDVSDKNENNILNSFKNITLVELDPKKVEILKSNIVQELHTHNKNYDVYLQYLNIINDDYLLANTGRYDVIIGNPPYVRYDNIPFEKLKYTKDYFLALKTEVIIYFIY